MKTMSLKALGERIRTTRIKRNMSQYDLYEKTGISTTQISAYENGKKSIGLKALVKIAVSLQVSLDELYFGPESKKPIATASNVGELIVNCTYALYEKNVVSSRGHETQSKMDGRGGPLRLVSIGFNKYKEILDNLVHQLDEFERSKKDYPEPESFRNQLLAAAANQINKVINSVPTAIGACID